MGKTGVFVSLELLVAHHSPEVSVGVLQTEENGHWSGVAHCSIPVHDVVSRDSTSVTEIHASVHRNDWVVAVVTIPV